MTDRVTDQNERILEGTWEEIAPHASEFENRRLRLIVQSEESAAQTEEEPRNLADAMSPFFEKVDRLVPEKPAPETDPHKILFGEVMEEKAKRLGLTL